MLASWRDSKAASRTALEREQRWETVRRLRVDAGRASSGRLVQGPLGGDGLELRTPAGVVRWLSSEGELLRTTDHSPAVQPVPFGASFELERTGGRVFVRYRLGDGASALEGRALLGAAP